MRQTSHNLIRWRGRKYSISHFGFIVTMNRWIVGGYRCRHGVLSTSKPPHRQMTETKQRQFDCEALWWWWCSATSKPNRREGKVTFCVTFLYFVYVRFMYVEFLEFFPSVFFSISFRLAVVAVTVVA